MKIIDKNGRLFGKINVIDFLVIIFLLCLTPMLYFGYRLYQDSKLTAAKLGEMMQEKALAQAKIATQELRGWNLESEKYEKIINDQEDKKAIISLTNRLEDILLRIVAAEKKLDVILSSPKSKND